jgi:hypothetical protein
MAPLLPLLLLLLPLLLLQLLPMLLACFVPTSPAVCSDQLTAATGEVYPFFSPVRGLFRLAERFR